MGIFCSHGTHLVVTGYGLLLIGDIMLLQAKFPKHGPQRQNMPGNYEISKISKSFPFAVDAKVDILHKDMKKIMEKLDVILSRHHGNQVRTKYSFRFLPTVLTATQPSKSIVVMFVIIRNPSSSLARKLLLYQENRIFNREKLHL